MVKYPCAHKKEKRDCFICKPFIAMARKQRRKLRQSLQCKTIKDTYNEYLGCTYRYFYERLSQEERRNIGRWQLDHIIPITSFDVTDEQQIFECCNYRNIRLISRGENFAKASRVDQDLLLMMELPYSFE